MRSRRRLAQEACKEKKPRRSAVVCNGKTDGDMKERTEKRKQEKRKRLTGMKIMDKKVLHKRFGMGSIIGLKGNRIYVSFGKVFGDKVFAYPEVFAEDMKMMDADLQEEIMEEVAGRN